MQTSLRIKENGKFTNLVIITTFMEGEEGYGELSVANDEFSPVGVPKRLAIGMSEEDYHRGLRQDAAKANQLVRQYCTDPELSPKSSAKVIKIKNERTGK